MSAEVDIRLHYLDDVARANGLPFGFLIEVAMREDTFALIVPKKERGEWNATEHQPNVARSLQGHVEIDTSDPSLAKLITDEWALVRVIEWGGRDANERLLSGSFVPPGDGWMRPPDSPEPPEPRAQVSLQVVHRRLIAVRESAVPIVWFGGGVVDVGLKLPTYTEAGQKPQLATPGIALPERAVRRERLETCERLIAGLSYLVAASKPGRYVKAGRPIVAPIAEDASSRVDPDNIDRARTYKDVIADAIKAYPENG